MATPGDPGSSLDRGDGYPSDPVLRLQITHITSTMSGPLPSLRHVYTPSHLATAIPPGLTPYHMPVMRIFGTTASLQKICANIHLCYPYFFVPFPMDSSDPLRPERVIKLCQRFAVSLNHAICLATRQNPNSKSNKYGGGTDPKHLHVVSVMLVKGIPFYGYHIGYSYFLKVSLVNPQKLYVALEQLRKPVVLGREWQPHEAHMNHVLQFMCDFDLYGCGWLELGGGTFRDPLPEGDPYESPPRGPVTIFNSLTTPAEMTYPPGQSPSRDTHAPLEIDVLPHQILNRRRLKPRNLHHNFIELLHQPLDPNEKLVPAVAELWEDERRRRAQRGLNLSEEAMMPGSGGMGGRNMEELGYKVEGKEYGVNKGGEWKISDELWEMLEVRMAVERRRKGKLTFERFSGDISAGKEGEKRKYDKWVMTTFEAVSAHWPERPKPPKSTQRSKKSGLSKASSMVAPSSPLPPPPLTSSPNGKHLSSSPTRPLTSPYDIKQEINDDVPFGRLDPVQNGNGDLGDAMGEETESEDEEENPFNLFAMTQASQGAEVKVELNENAIARDVGPELDADDEEDLRRQQHEENARQHAEKGTRLRASQASQASKGEGGDSDEEYGDAMLDELFLQTVPGGFSAHTTPRKANGYGSHGVTPTTVGSGGSTERRRQMRDQRMREMAGLGDLSTIFDRSSVSLSPNVNPYDDRSRPQTPSKAHGGESEVKTPTSLHRNLFARRNGSSPLNSPSRRGQPRTPGNAVVLPPSRMSVVGWTTPSPEDAADESPSKRPASTSKAPREVKPQVKLEPIDVKPSAFPSEIKASDEDAIALPPAQKLPSPETTSGETLTQPNSAREHPHAGKRLPSPTLRNEENDSTPPTSAMPPPISSQDRPRKRVRMASPIDPPDNPFTQHSQLSQRSNAVSSGQKSVISSQSGITTDTTTSSNHGQLSRVAWQWHALPPEAKGVERMMEEHGVDPVEYQEPYYSNAVDIPPRPKLFAGRMFNLKGNGVAELPEFETSIADRGKWLKGKGRRKEVHKARYGWEYCIPPPRLAKVVTWCETMDSEAASQHRKQALLHSQLAHPTQKSKFGFKASQKKRTKAAEREHQNMSVLAIEVFAKSRHQLLPDPEKDEITAIFYAYQNEDDSLPDTTINPGCYAGYVVVSSAQTLNGRAALPDIPSEEVDSELDLINWVIDRVREWDPDVLAGWELHNASWGYLASRANEAFSMDLVEELSRVVGGHTGPRKDFYSATHSSTFKVSGRHILNIWRICRSELTLTQYSFENIAFQVLHQRVPHYSAASLTALWKSKTPEHTARVLKYFFQRVVMYVEIVDAAEIITKNAEFARVFGVDFASVMFRGSQYKVESFMFRIAKPESFVLVSPSKAQVGLQNAPFAVPLIAEPESKYYNHPIIVLDFQSLYPSVMIAYNICFSTCLGRIEKFKGTDKFGFTELKMADGLLELLRDYLTVTPNGMVFVKPCVRKSLLAKMLGEILDTRVMVKHAMKGARGDKSLTQLLNARQLGLKLMANVTYGYTSATYSGRMPCIEVADSIVQTGRETLEKAQEIIHSRKDWGAQVIYGDTDSLFIALPGRSKDQAFKIGNDIADTVTATNPKPVKLKFEKVYMGSVLMAKKRYVGFKYEHPDEKEPVFDAKGIETIRRDGFPAQQKIEEVCLKMLFRNQDLSQIKEFCRGEWTKILQGRVSIQDFIVAKEVRLGSYSEKGVPPPGAAVAYRRILKDPRDEPQYAERVPYIVSNADGRRLIERARMPEEMLANRQLGLDAEYYIRNLLIPPLSRIFNLVGADVEHWYDSMPRTKRVSKYDQRSTGKMRIDSHFRSSHCLVCGVETSSGICRECGEDPSNTSHALLSRQHLAEEKMAAIHELCASCSGTPINEPVRCDSIDCPILYARVQAHRDVEDLGEVREVVERMKNVEVGEMEAQGEFEHALDW